MSSNDGLVLLLVDFDKAISWPDTKRVIDTSLAFFEKTFTLDRISISLFNKDSKGYTVFTLDTSIPKLSNGQFISLNTQELEVLSKQLKTSYLNDLTEKTPLSKAEQWLLQAGVNSYSTVPLFTGGSMLGSLNLITRDPLGIPEETEALARLLSSRLSLALVHAQLHDSLVQKEQERLTSEQNYRDLIDQAGDAILKGDSKGNIVQANLSATELFGYSQSDLLGLNFSALFDPAVLAEKPLRYDLISEGQTVISERVLRCKDGTPLPVEMNSKRLSDGSFVSIIRDLTYRNETHLKISNQDIQIKALFNAVPAPLYAKDKEGKYTHLNDAYLNFFGKTRSEMIGKTAEQCWPKETSKRFEEDDRLLLEENKRQSYPAELIHVSKGVRQVQVYKARYFDTSGEISGFIGTLWDVTELRAAEDRYSNLFTYSPDPIVVHDGKHILTANKAAVRFFKTDNPEKYFLKPISEMIHPDSHQESNKRIATLFETNEPNDLTHQVFIISTGETRDVETISVPIAFEGQKAIMTSFRDITEQKQGRDRLRISEENFRSLFDSNPNPMIVHVDRSILFANQAALKFGGKKDLNDVLGVDALSFVHEDSRGKAEANALKIIETGEATPVGEQVYLGAGGKPRLVESRGVPLIIEGKTAVMVAFRDITEQKATRVALLNSEERYRRSFVYSPTPMVLHDRGILIDANVAALEFAGSTPLKELVGMDLFQLIHPDFRKEAEEGVEKLLVSDVPGDVREQKYLTLSGEERWVETVGVPVYQSDRPLVLVSFNDIHDSKIARQQLEESRKQLQLITENVPYLIILTDLELTALYMNTVALKWFHLDPETYAGLPLSALFEKDLLDRATRFIPDLLKGETCQFDYQYHSNKNKFYAFWVNLIPIMDLDGQVIAFMAQINDVTEQETARKDLAENKELLELIVDTIPGLFSYADISQNYLYVNQAYADWHKKTCSEIIGQPIHNILPRETYSYIKPYLSNVKSGKAQNYTRQVLDNEGTKRILDIRYIPHFDHQEKPKAFLTAIQDITQQQEYEAHQKALRDLASSLTKEMDPHGVGQVSATSIRSAFKSDALTIERYDFENRVIEGIYSEDTLPDKSKPQEFNSSTISFSGISKKWLDPNLKAFCENRPDEPPKVTGPKTIPFGGERLSKSLLYAPLRWEGEIIGLVSVQSYIPGYYSLKDTPNLQSYADQIGGALIRAQKDAQLKEHQKTLEREEEKYRSLIENAGDAVFVTTLKGDIHTVNDQACHSLGYTHDSLSKMNIRDIDPSFFKLISGKALSALKNTGTSITLESQQLKADKSLLSVELRVSLTTIHKRQHFLCFVRDITERKLFELRQNALQQLARDLNESTDMHTVGQMAARAIRSYFDSDAFAIEYYDLEKQLIVGVYTEDTFQGKEVARELPSRDTPMASVSNDFIQRNSFAHVRNRSKRELEDLQGSRPFGSSRLSHSLLFAPLLWDGGNIGVLTVQSYSDNKYSDLDLPNIQTFANQIGGALIRARKDEALARQQQALIEGEKKYRSMIENAGDALFVTSVSGNILAFNQNATLSLGYEEDELLKVNLGKINPWFKTSFSPEILAKLSSSESSTTIETTHLRKDGSLIPVELRVGSMELEGEPCLLYFARDISERKDSEVFYTTLRKMARKLTVSLRPRELGKIASSVLYNLFAHDAFVLNRIDLKTRTAQSLYGEDTFQEENQPRETKVRQAPFSFSNYEDVMILPTPKIINREKGDEFDTMGSFGDQARKSRSLVFVPIFWSGEQIGVFSLQSYTLHKFDQSDAEKLKIFANQIGGALVQAQTDLELTLQTNTLLEREQELEAAVEEREVLLKEVYHRTKNNMQVMTGLLEMHGYKTKNEQTRIVLTEMVDRITSMSMVHDLLYRSKNLSEIKLDVYMEKLVSRLVTAYQMTSGNIKLTFKLSSIPINIRLAVPLGLVINEIVSNTLKYAFPNDADGQITFSVTPCETNGLDLYISDNGCGFDSGFDLENTSSMGLRIIQDIVELQLFGTISSKTVDGVAYHIQIPDLNLD